MRPPFRALTRLVYCLLTLVSLEAGLAPGAAGQEAERTRRAEHVVLVSIDGLRPEFYLDPARPAPMLRQLMARGVHAEAVEGIYPTVTYPSHTTLITGARPARHGIFYNSPFEPGGITGRWYWEASAIRVPTLFSVVRAASKKSAALGWPVSVGAPIDWNVPEVWSLEAGADQIEVIRAASYPADLLAEIESEATGRLRPENFLIDHQTRDDRAGDAAAYLLTKYKPALLALHLIGTDHFQHEDGRESDRVERAIASADRAIAQIYEAAEQAGLLETTAFVVTGDHGHINIHTALSPNVALVQAGLMSEAPDRGRWRATFHTAAAAAFLHLADPQDREAALLARKAIEAMPAAVRNLFRIVEREELDRLGAAPEAVFALAPRPGIQIYAAATGPLVSPAKGATHGFLPSEPQMATGFVAAGAGIAKSGKAAKLQMVDIAPFIAELLGLKLPAAEGVPPLGFLTLRPPLTKP